MAVERRRHSRCHVGDNGIFVIDPSSSGIAVVRDIGVGGLKFEYLPGSLPAPHWINVDIAAGNKNGLLLSTVPCRVVYDIRDLVQNHTFTGSETRICGLCFNELTADQKEALHRLIER